MTYVIVHVLGSHAVDAKPHMYSTKTHGCFTHIICGVDVTVRHVMSQRQAYVLCVCVVYVCVGVCVCTGSDIAARGAIDRQTHSTLTPPCHMSL